MKRQSFNSGIVSFYRLENVALPGDMPTETLVKKVTLRYHRRTVGITRIYSAKQAGETVDNLIRCPLIKSIGAEDIAVTEDGAQYLVKLIQYPEDVEPPVTDLTLERLGTLYDIS